MDKGLIQGNSLVYFKDKDNLNISLVLTSPSYYTETPKRIKKDNEIGVGETKETYVSFVTSVIKDMSASFTDDTNIVMVIGRYEKASIETIILMIEDKLIDLGIYLNAVRYFDDHNSECVVVFSKTNNREEIPEFDKLQVYKRTGFFGEISPQILDWAITNFSKEGELVVDPFAGAGSTVNAAIKRDREALGIELNEDYIL